MSAKLEPFILVAKGARGAAAAKLVQDVTAAPGVFVFSELLDLPTIAALEQSHPKELQLLRLFAYQTYADYKQDKDSWPPLSPAHIAKLRLLTLATFASQTRILPYSLLLRELELGSVRELEDTIIDGMYQGVIRGKLDQRASQLEIEHAMGRDLGPGQIESLLAALKSWSDKTATVLNALDRKISETQRAEEAKLAAQADYERARLTAVQQVAASKSSSGGGSGPLGRIDNDSAGAGLMDVDSSGPSQAASKQTPSKKTGGAGGPHGRKRIRP